MSQSNEPTNQKRTEFLAAAAAIAAGTVAYGDIVRFDNPEGKGHFYWPFDILDVTEPADQQPGFGGFGDPTTMYQAYFSDFYPAFSYYTTFQEGGGAQIFSRGFASRYAAPLDTNTLVGPDLLDGAFISGTVFEFLFEACDMYYVGYPCYCYYYDCSNGSRGIIPGYTETYLGVRFDVGNGDQYGWIKIVRNGVEIDALAWGYETEPGKAIRTGATPCAEDISGNDGSVDTVDLLQLLQNWGSDGPGADLAAPLDVIDVQDLLKMLESWGFCSPPVAGMIAPEGTLAALAHGSRA